MTQAQAFNAARAIATALRENGLADPKLLAQPEIAGDAVVETLNGLAEIVVEFLQADFGSLADPEAEA